MDTTEEASNPTTKAAHVESLHILFILGSQEAHCLSVLFYQHRERLYPVKSMVGEVPSQVPSVFSEILHPRVSKGYSQCFLSQF